MITSLPTGGQLDNPLKQLRQEVTGLMDAKKWKVVCVCVCVCVSRSVVSDSVTLWIVAWQAHLSMEFSRQEYWSELPFPFPGDLPNPGIEPGPPTLQADSLPSDPPG